MRRIAFVVVLVLPLFAAACGDDDHHDNMPMNQGDMPMDSAQMPMSQGDRPMGDMSIGQGQMPAHGHSANSPIADGARRIEIAGDDYRFSPAAITARRGEDIALVLTSVDLEHDLVIDEFDAHVYAPAGQTASGGFNASDLGRFIFYCSIPGHREAGMEGRLDVEAG
jgi:plastocyanin